MQQDNFRNLNRAIFTHRKHLESRVSVFSYCFPIIKQNTFHYLSLFSPSVEKDGKEKLRKRALFTQ